MANINNNDLFSHNRETLDQGNQIFSVGGTPSFRLNRREQSTSNVFPAGCMGSRSGEEITASGDKGDESEHDLKNVNQEEDLKTFDVLEEAEKKEEQDEDKVENPVEGYVWKRNPLTGEGMELEEPKSHKKGFRNKLNKWVW